MITAILGGPHGWGGWAVTSGDAAIAPAGTLLGFCGFQAPHIDGEGPELGYGVVQRYWGKGVVSEAAGRAVDWFFLVAGRAAPAMRRASARRPRTG